MILFLLAADAAPVMDMQSPMQAVSVDKGVDLFKRICFTPFPDPAAAQQAIADPALNLVKQTKTPTEAMQPGDRWTSNMVQVSYVDADWMPRDIGSPQCSVTVLLEGAPQHSDVATVFKSALALPEVKLGKNGARAQTTWDVPGRDPDKWRIFLTTENTPSGPEMRAIIMNLRGKKK